jgi:hypothetical protein
MNYANPEFQARVVGKNRVSNTERQRQFRMRNPDYYRNLQAKARAAMKARTAARIAAERAAAAEALALAAPVEAIAIPEPTALLTPEAFVELITRPAPLMLPAPVVDPLIEELNQLRAKLRARTSASSAEPREMVEVPLARHI